MKKIFLVVLVLVLGGGAVALGIWFRKRGGAVSETISAPGDGLPTVGITDSSSSQIPENAGIVPVSQDQRFGIISQRKILDYAVDDQNRVFIASEDGDVVLVAGGKEEIMYDAEGSIPFSAQFSARGEKLLASFGSIAKLRWSIFDTKTASWNPLSLELARPMWSPNDRRIAYIAPQNTRFTISVANFDLSLPKPQSVFTFSSPILNLSWNSPESIVISEPPTGLAPGSLWKLGLKKQTIEPVVLDQPGASALWNKKGDAGLVFVSGGKGAGGAISLVDEKGGALQKLSVLTLPEKCVFHSISLKEQSSSTEWLLCAVPRETREFSLLTLPDDYYQKSFVPSDNVYGINVKTGAQIPVFEDPDFSVDATMLKASGETIFFVNRRDSKLYAVSLKPILEN